MVQTVTYREILWSPLRGVATASQTYGVTLLYLVSDSIGIGFILFRLEKGIVSVMYSGASDRPVEQPNIGRDIVHWSYVLTQHGWGPAD